MVKKCWLPCSVISCGILCLLIGILTPILLGIIIKSEVSDRVELTKSNGKAQWGKIPGDFNILLRQEFHLFNLLNPEGVMEGEVPVIEQSPGYTYQEFDEFLDIDYGDSVSYTLLRYLKKTKHTIWPSNINENDLITTVSVGALGGWDQVKHFNRQQLAIISLYELVIGLEGTLPSLAYGLGMRPFLVDLNVAQQTIFTPAGISPELGKAIWNDQRYGMSNSNTLQVWIIALEENLVKGNFIMPKPINGTMYLLWRQFGLNSTQLEGIFQGQFLNIYNLITLIFYIDYDCPSIDGFSEICDPIYLAGVQWSSSGFTLTPPAIPPIGPSIIFINQTGTGYPEMYYFYEYTTNKLKYSNYSFTPDTYRSLFNYNRTTGFPLYDPHTILDVGQMNTFFELGNSENFASMATVFNLTDNTTARILWDYVNSIIDFTGLQGCFDPEIYDLNNRGISSEAALGQVGSPTLYNFTLFLSGSLLSNLTTVYDYLRFEELGIDCPTIVKDNAPGCSYICNNYDLAWDDGGISLWIQVSWNDVNSEPWNLFQKLSGLTNAQMNSLFTGQSTLISNFTMFDNELKINYNCSNSGPQCDPVYLTNKQWGQSFVTLNLPEIFTTRGGIERSSSISNYPFFGTVYKGTPEYGAYALSKGKPVIANETLIESLLSFSSLFSPPMIQRYFIFVFAQNYSAINSVFGVDDDETFTAYLRYFIDLYFFGGLIRTKTVEDILFTDDDPLVHYQINLNPLRGGNPALIVNSSQVAQNRSREMVLKPGKHFQNKINSGQNDIDSLRKYEKYGGVDYFNFPTPYYNGVGADGGQNITFINLNPWAEPVKVKGTDGWQFKPFITSDDVLYYYLDISGLLFRLLFQKHLTHKGYNCLKYEIDNSILQNVTQNPKQSILYQYGPNGLSNQTGIFAAPIFGSKPFFYQAEPILSKMVNFTNPEKDVTYLQSFFYVEKNTGLVLEGSELLQFNLEVKPDILYPKLGLQNLQNYGYHTYLPLLVLNRYVDIPQHTLDNKIGVIKLIPKIKLAGMIIGYAFAGVFLLISGYILWRRRRARRMVNSLPKEINAESTLLRKE